MASPSSAAPHGIMLAVPEKRTTGARLFRDTHIFNSSAYAELRSMRSDVERPPAAGASAGARIDLLIRYYQGLASGDDPCAYDDTLSFTWHDAFRAARSTTEKSIRLEKAALLFNIGAANSRIGATGGSLQGACTSFRRAAGAFSAVAELARERADGDVGKPWTVDLSPECLAMLEQLMLAQACECTFEHSIATGKTHALCSKVARQASIHYEEALSAITSALLEPNFDKSWSSHIRLKVAQFKAEACYHYAIVLHEKAEIGEEIARLKVGIAGITDAKRAVRGAAPPLYDAISKLEHQMNAALETANNENNLIYVMRVPAPASLDALSGIHIARPSPVDEVLQRVGVADTQAP